MSTSRAFCHRCSAEVEDAGGFCLLGHRLIPVVGAVPPPPPPPVMSDLHDEVERTFAEAQAQVAAAVPEEPAKPATSRYTSSVEATWAELESAPAPSPDDPINTFAPPPRMDWGPQRTSLRFKLRRQRAEAPV